MALIDHGGFGCVFSPELECKSKKKNKTKKYISKLQTLKDSEYEFNMMKLFIKRIKRVVPNYYKYFVLDDVSICSPSLSRVELKKKYSSCNIINTTNYFKNMVMPYMGINFEKYLYNIFPKIDTAFTEINLKLINLYKNAIVPMNKIGFYHNDLKVTNILVDDTLDFRIIDFGLMNNIRYKYFVFNNPLNSILLSNKFLDYYINNKNTTPIRNILVNYLLQYKLYKDTHYVQLIQPLLLLMDSSVPITNETAKIHPLLFNYYLQTISTTLPYNEVIQQNRSIYLHNLDTIGFLSIYGSMYLLYTSNVYDPQKKCIVDAIKKLYLKYIFMMENISYSEFMDDVYKLNLCF